MLKNVFNTITHGFLISPEDFEKTINIGKCPQVVRAEITVPNLSKHTDICTYPAQKWAKRDSSFSAKNIIIEGIDIDIYEEPDSVFNGTYHMILGLDCSKEIGSQCFISLFNVVVMSYDTHFIRPGKIWAKGAAVHELSNVTFVCVNNKQSNSSKVYCVYCKHCHDPLARPVCKHPDNIGETWHSPQMKCKQLPQELNANNDCKWFEVYDSDQKGK